MKKVDLSLELDLEKLTPPKDADPLRKPALPAKDEKVELVRMPWMGVVNPPRPRKAVRGRKRTDPRKLPQESRPAFSGISFLSGALLVSMVWFLASRYSSTPSTKLVAVDSATASQPAVAAPPRAELQKKTFHKGVREKRSLASTRD